MSGAETDATAMPQMRQLTDLEQLREADRLARLAAVLAYLKEAIQELLAQYGSGAKPAGLIEVISCVTLCLETLRSLTGEYTLISGGTQLNTDWDQKANAEKRLLVLMDTLKALKLYYEPGFFGFLKRRPAISQIPGLFSSLKERYSEVLSSIRLGRLIGDTKGLEL